MDFFQHNTTLNTQHLTHFFKRTYHSIDVDKRWAFDELAIVFKPDAGIGFDAPGLAGKRLAGIIKYF